MLRRYLIDVPLAQRDGHVPTLDGWRALAISLVLIAHMSDGLSHFMNPGTAWDVAKLKSAGLFGVQLFFGLSGFLITGKLIESSRDASGPWMRQFYLRRAFRILPAAFVFVAVVALLGYHEWISVSAGRVACTLLFFANYCPSESVWYLGHFWSLAVEEHFYFLWPLAIALLPASRSRIWLACTFVTLIAIWRLLDFRFGLTGATPAFFWGRTDIQADGIMWGALVALACEDAALGPKLRGFVGKPVVRGAVLLCLLALLMAPEVGWKTMLLLLTVKACLIPLAILGTVTQAGSLTSRLLELAPFRWVGRLSYSLYLWQQLFCVWATSQVTSLSDVQQPPVNLLLAIVMAWVSFLAIELPMQAVGRRVLRSSSVSADRAPGAS